MGIKELKEKCDDGIEKCNNVIRKKFEIYWFWIALGIIAFLGLVSRRLQFGFVSHDVSAFLIGWYRNFFDYGAKYALGQEIGDYTPAYMYILAIISWFRPDPDSLKFVHALKYFSCFFDYMTAVYVVLICLKRLKSEKWVALLGFTVALFTPTILLNSSYWGQCDGIFSAFCVASVYYLLGDHQRTALIMFGCAFAFKLQAIFLLPFLVYLVLVKKLKLRFFLYIPLVYILFALPSTFCGRNFSNIMKIYFSQTGSYPYLLLNAPSVYTFISSSFDGDEGIINYVLPASTFMGLALLGTMLLVFFQKKKEPDYIDLLEIAFFFALFAPFVLPRMHERYFYLADALACAFLVARPRKFYIPVLSIFGSMTGYINYLFGYSWFRSDNNATLRMGSICILVAIILTVYDILFANKSDEHKQTLTEGLM